MKSLQYISDILRMGETTKKETSIKSPQGFQNIFCYMKLGPIRVTFNSINYHYFLHCNNKTDIQSDDDDKLPLMIIMTRNEVNEVRPNCSLVTQQL